MFGKHHARRHIADQVAGQAWDHLTAAVEAAQESTRRRYADRSKRIGDGTREARRRAAAAYDALAGRSRRSPWEWFAAATLFGVVAGWIATALTRRVRDRSDAVSVPDSLAEEFTPSTRS